MEDVKNVETKDTKKKKNKIWLVVVLFILIIIGFYFFRKINKTEDIGFKVKSSLDKIVEKSDLETINITYNVIAKKCQDNLECNVNSNNIDDFLYVVSCKGSITAGIDFKDVKIDIDKKNKKIVVKVPEATIKGEPNIGSIKFLNGDEIPAEEYPNARKLCQETTILKSKEDDKLIPMAKEQALVVLEEYYNQWIKAYDSSYKVEIS